MISFIGKDWERSHECSASVYYFVHIACVLVIVASSFIPKRRSVTEEIKKRE